MIPLLDFEFRDRHPMGARASVWFSLNAAGQQDVQDGYFEGRPAMDILLDLLEYHLCNGWDTINARDLGWRPWDAHVKQEPFIITNSGIEMDDMGYIQAIHWFYTPDRGTPDDWVRWLLVENFAIPFSFHNWPYDRHLLYHPRTMAAYRQANTREILAALKEKRLEVK